MSDTGKTAFGLPVSGQISYYSDSPAEQWPIERLTPIIQALLSDPEVNSFGWEQYTPYFNDGDACIFSAGSAWVCTSAAADKNDWHPQVRRYAWGDRPISPQHHLDFSEAVESGHFNKVLLEKFGDPAEVTVSRHGITVEYYEHD